MLKLNCLPRCVPDFFKKFCINVVCSNENRLATFLHCEAPCSLPPFHEQGMGYSRKKSKYGLGIRKWNFQGYWRKSMWKFQRSIKKEVGFPGVFKKNSGNFHGSWFLTLKFPRSVTQFCRIFRDESLFYPEFLRVKSQISNFGKNSIINIHLSPCIFIWNIANIAQLS